MAEHDENGTDEAGHHRTRRRGPDPLALIVGLLSPRDGGARRSSAQVPDLSGFDPRWLLAGGAAAVGLMLLVGSLRGRRTVTVELAPGGWGASRAPREGGTYGCRPRPPAFPSASQGFRAPEQRYGSEVRGGVEGEGEGRRRPAGPGRRRRGSRARPARSRPHHVHAGHPRHLAQRGHRLGAGRHALGRHPLRRHPAQPPDQRVRARPPRGCRPMNSNARSDRIGPTPGQDPAPLVQPEVAHPRHPRPKPATSNTNCVWHELRAPSSTLPASRSGAAGAGVHGAEQEPRRRVDRAAGQQRARRRAARARPASGRCESRSNTGVASAWSPRSGRSPVISTRLGTPSAPAESRSDCSAIRLRSRQVICITGSRPAASAATLPARLDTRTWAPWLSVMLAASTQSRSTRRGLADRAEVRAARRPDLRGHRELARPAGRPEP